MATSTNETTRPSGARVRQSQKAWKYIRDIADASSENLNRIAVRDGVNTYAYGLMFREWERYASVFSALGMTQKNHACVGLMGCGASEVIFAFYGLNMVGAQVSLVSSFSVFRPDRVMQTIKEERLTDFIVVDDLAQPNLIAALLKNKDELGLSNVILPHSRMGGSCVGPAELTFNEFNYHALRRMEGTVFMGDLIAAVPGADSATGRCCAFAERYAASLQHVHRRPAKADAARLPLPRRSSRFSGFSTPSLTPTPSRRSTPEAASHRGKVVHLGGPTPKGWDHPFWCAGMTRKKTGGRNAAARAKGSYGRAPYR